MNVFLVLMEMASIAQVSKAIFNQNISIFLYFQISMSVLIPISTTVVIMPTALTLLGATSALALRATLEMDLCA